MHRASGSDDGYAAASVFIALLLVWFAWLAAVASWQAACVSSFAGGGGSLSAFANGGGGGLSATRALKGSNKAQTLAELASHCNVQPK